MPNSNLSLDKFPIIRHFLQVFLFRKVCICIWSRKKSISRDTSGSKSGDITALIKRIPWALLSTWFTAAQLLLLEQVKRLWFIFQQANTTCCYFQINNDNKCCCYLDAAACLIATINILSLGYKYGELKKARRISALKRYLDSVQYNLWAYNSTAFLSLSN